MARRYWLFKSDPDTFGWDDLVRSPGRTTRWDGVRNYQARNTLRDDVREGDSVLFYHSQVERAVVGTAEVVRAGYPDPTQFDARSPGHDPDSPKEDPRWYAVDIRAGDPLPVPVALDAMREIPALRDFPLLRRGQRLSVLPVSAREWEAILRLGRAGQKEA
jgi:predicted RNA-binding protein with PUA-like domain